MSYTQVDNLSHKGKGSDSHGVPLQSLLSTPRLLNPSLLVNEDRNLHGPHDLSAETLTQPCSSSDAPEGSAKDDAVLRKHSLKRRRFNHYLSQSWLPEFGSWFLAFLCFAAIVAILVAFDGRSEPQWKINRFGITLGALVSVFASMGGFVLMVPVGSAMGELKWMWFLRERPVADFETVDKASHGPAGSFLLLVKRKGGYVAAVGATLTLLQLAIGPFVQQVIQYEVHLQNVTQASIPAALKYEASGNYGGGLDTDVTMKAAVMNAVLDFNAPSTDFDIPAVCSTGNCTWPAYQSLGVCSICVDITSDLQATPVQFGNNWTLPNTMWLEVDSSRSNEGLVSMVVNNSLPSVAFKGNHLDNLLLDLFVLIGPANYSSGVQTAAFASECILEVCMQSYTASEVNGTFQEVLAADPQILSLAPEGIYPSSSGNISINYYSFRNVGSYLQKTFIGEVLEENSLGGLESFPDPIPQALFFAMNSTHNLNVVMANVAKSMTRNIRTRPNAGPFIIGQALSEKSFVRIEWAWMSLPVGVLFAVLVFLLAVVARTRRSNVPKWKDNSLVTLFSGLDVEGRSFASQLDHGSILEDAAAGLLVRMEHQDDGWGLKTIR